MPLSFQMGMRWIVVGIPADVIDRWNPLGRDHDYLKPDIAEKLRRKVRGLYDLP